MTIARRPDFGDGLGEKLRADAPGASITITEDGIRIQGVETAPIAKAASLVHPEFAGEPIRMQASIPLQPARVDLEVKKFPIEPMMAMQADAIRNIARSPQQAFFGLFDDDESDPFERDGPLAIVTINGPLMQRGGWWYDGYEAIRDRFGAALSDPSIGGVALLINSPGGVCAGCFEAAKAMRKMAAAAGKPVFAFADEMAYSAGYAMACVAGEIYLPEPGGVGSVGVIGVLYDAVKFNEDLGFNVVVIASGDQKADGHPDAPLSEEAIKRYRDRTNQLAGLFAELVGEARGKTSAEVLALEAACFYGRSAVSAGLANGVKTRDQFLAYAQREAKKTLPQAATAKATTETETNIAADSGDKNGEGKNMAMITLAAIALALGLKHDADEDACAARGKELLDFERDALKTTGTDNSEDALGAMTAGKVAIGKVAELGAEISSLKAEKDKSDIEALIVEAKAAGKITSDDFEAEMRELGAENPKRLKSTLAKLPVVVGATKPTTEPLANVTLTSEEIQVARQMGISPEALMKSKADAQAAANGGK